MSNLFLVPFAILAGVVLVGLLAAAINGEPANRYAALRSRRANEGASPAEFDAEMTLRITAVEFRRKVSLAVFDCPTEPERIIREIAKEEAMLLAATDKGLAKTFLDWVETAGMSEILLPAAQKVVWRAARGGKAAASEVVAAALRQV